MKKLNKNNSGFTVVEVLLVILTLAIIGVAGYFVAKHIDTKKITPTATVTKPTTTSKQATTTQTITPTTTNYFTFTQWGVRAPYNGSLTLQYQPDSSNSSNMDVSSTQLNAGGPSDICTTADAAAGYVGRYLPTQDIPTESGPGETAQSYVSQDFAASNSQPPAYSKVGNYYYIYWEASNNCNDDTLLQQTQAAFENVVDNLKSY